MESATYPNKNEDRGSRLVGESPSTVDVSCSNFGDQYSNESKRYTPAEKRCAFSRLSSLSNAELERQNESEVPKIHREKSVLFVDTT
jgi:hypothetical protein